MGGLERIQQLAPGRRAIQKIVDPRFKGMWSDSNLKKLWETLSFSEVSHTVACSKIILEWLVSYQDPNILPEKSDATHAFNKLL